MKKQTAHIRGSKIVVGMDVHKEKIVCGVLPESSERVTEITSILNEGQAIEKFVKRWTNSHEAEFVYEAGCCGYALQRQITGLGGRCVVIAPGLIPKKAGDQVKTDRKDAEKLARLYRAGELTEIRIPTLEEESARDLVRAREDILEDRLRARHRLSKFLLRHGRKSSEGRAWSQSYSEWVKSQKFEVGVLQQSYEAVVRAVQEAQARLETLDQQVLDLAEQPSVRTAVRYLRCLKGVDTLSALTLLVETQDFRRFERAPSFMNFMGLTPSEYSSGEKTRRGHITKVGNAHARRILVESAWSYRGANVVSRALAERRSGCPQKIVQVARKAQDRLHRTFRRMEHRNKPAGVTVVAVARELAGFVWAIAQEFPKSAAA